MATLLNVSVFAFLSVDCIRVGKLGLAAIGRSRRMREMVKKKNRQDDMRWWLRPKANIPMQIINQNLPK